MESVVQSCSGPSRSVPGPIDARLLLSVSNEPEFASAGEELRAVSREPIAPRTPVMAYNHPVSQDGSQKNRELGGTEELRNLRLSKRLPGPPGAIGRCSGGDSTLCVFVKV